MTIRSIKFGVVAAALFAVAQAHAGTDGYIGVGFGPGHVATDCPAPVTCDNSSTGSKIYGGYKFSNNLSAELGYYNFGKAKLTLGALEENIKVTGFGASVAYMGEFADKWTWSARAGLASMKAKDDLSGDSTSKMKLIAGLGLGYSFTPEFSVQAAWDFSQAEANNSTGTVHLLTFGAAYAF